MPSPAQTVEASPTAACPDELEISVVMPCLNEARSLATCIDKAARALQALSSRWEIVVADNGSGDGSPQIALDHGARVVHVAAKGYGNACLGGVAAARGRYVVIGDSDDSYDFSEIGPFVERLRQGSDLVMGSRFQGHIDPGAMPALHRYLGNPVLTGILNLLFHAGVSDAHCGLRAFTRAAWERMHLRSRGMELASEMVIRAAQEKLRIAEVPITLHKDGRDRAPHLRSFRDGWRHLRFMLMFSPAWLFFVPGALLAIPGIALTAVMPFFDIRLFGHLFSFHFSLLGSTLSLVGLGIAQLGVYAKVIFVSAGIGEDRIGRWLLDRFNLELTVLAGAVIAAVGTCGDGAVLGLWLTTHMGELSSTITSVAILSSTAIVLGLQLIFSAFFLGILRASRTQAWVE